MRSFLNTFGAILTTLVLVWLLTWYSLRGMYAKLRKLEAELATHTARLELFRQYDELWTFLSRNRQTICDYMYRYPVEFTTPKFRFVFLGNEGHSEYDRLLRRIEPRP